MRNLTSAEEPDVAPAGAMLQGQALYCGYYLNELTVRLLPMDDPHPNLFSHYVNTLSGLAVQDAGFDGLLRNYELELLEELGYSVTLDTDVPDGNAIEPGRLYHYVPDAGPFPDGAEIPPRSVSIHGSSLVALARRQLVTEQEVRESRRLFRVLVDERLDGRPLHSRTLFQELYGGGSR